MGDAPRASEPVRIRPRSFLPAGRSGRFAREAFSTFSVPPFLYLPNGASSPRRRIGNGLITSPNIVTMRASRLSGSP